MTYYPTIDQINNTKGEELYALAQKYNIRNRKDMKVDLMRKAIIKRIKYIRMTDVLLREASKEGLTVVRKGHVNAH